MLTIFYLLFLTTEAIALMTLKIIAVIAVARRPRDTSLDRLYTSRNTPAKTDREEIEKELEGD